MSQIEPCKSVCIVHTQFLRTKTSHGDGGMKMER